MTKIPVKQFDFCKSIESDKNSPAEIIHWILSSDQQVQKFKIIRSRCLIIVPSTSPGILNLLFEQKTTSSSDDSTKVCTNLIRLSFADCHFAPICLVNADGQRDCHAGASSGQAALFGSGGVNADGRQAALACIASVTRLIGSESSEIFWKCKHCFTSSKHWTACLQAKGLF